jgi:uncharacterized protein YbaP (TraB family)
MRRWLPALIAILTATLLANAPAEARPPVWIVRDADSELVLFGSVHILPPGLDWRPPAFSRALKRADDLWFELPIDPATEARTTALASRLGVLPPDQSLFRLLPPADAARLIRVAKAYDADAAMLDRLRPWLAEVALAAAAYKKAGAGGADGVEQAVSAAAPPRVRRRAFETPEQQIELLAAASAEDQLASLRQTLQEMEEKPDEFEVLVRAWMGGDLATLDREALAPIRKASPRLFQRLVVDRNARWAAALNRRLKGRGRTVVVVGMGHLIGREGVPARLRALGYRVEGP